MEENYALYASLFPVGSFVKVNGEKFFVQAQNAIRSQIVIQSTVRRYDSNLTSYDLKDIEKDK